MNLDEAKRIIIDHSTPKVADLRHALAWCINRIELLEKIIDDSCRDTCEDDAAIRKIATECGVPDNEVVFDGYAEPHITDVVTSLVEHLRGGKPLGFANVLSLRKGDGGRGNNMTDPCPLQYANSMDGFYELFTEIPKWSRSYPRR